MARAMQPGMLWALEDAAWERERAAPMRREEEQRESDARLPLSGEPRCGIPSRAGGSGKVPVGAQEAAAASLCILPLLLHRGSAAPMRGSGRQPERCRHRRCPLVCKRCDLWARIQRIFFRFSFSFSFPSHGMMAATRGIPCCPHRSLASSPLCIAMKRSGRWDRFASSPLWEAAAPML